MLSLWVRPAARLSCLHRLTWPLASSATNLQLPGKFERSASTHALLQNTNLTPEKAFEAIERYKLLQQVDEENIKEAAEKLKEIGIPVEEFSQFPEVLSNLAISIENRHGLLLECGFHKVVARDLAHYKRVTNLRISLLKAHGCIPENTNIVAHIVEHIPGLPKSVAESIMVAVGPVSETTTSLRNLHWEVMHHFLCWRLKADSTKIQQVMRTYVRLRNKSIALLAESLDILTNELNFTTKKILQHGYLIHSYPQQMRASLRLAPTLGGLPLVEVVQRHPRILLTNTNTLVKTQQLLTHFGITNDAIRRCFDVFTLATRTVRERLVTVINDPQMGGLLGHPRILLLVIYSRTANQRLEYLRQLQMNCFSLHLISASSSRIFKKYTAEREDRSKGYDVLYYLSHNLGCDASSLRLALNFHPHWHHVPLASVRSTLLLLAERGFPPDKIRSCVHLLLYPAERVAETLDSMTFYPPTNAEDWSHQLKYKHIELSDDTTEMSQNQDPLFKEIVHQKYTEDNFMNGVLVEISQEDSSVTDWHLVLHTCIYLLEKPHHFTGDGIWTHQSVKDEKEVVSLAVM